MRKTQRRDDATRMYLWFKVPAVSNDEREVLDLVLGVLDLAYDIGGYDFYNGTGNGMTIDFVMAATGCPDATSLY